MEYHVTEVLSILRPDNNVPCETMERAARAGIEFHRYALGNLITPIGLPTPEGIEADVSRFDTWFRDHVRKIATVNGELFVEKTFVLPHLQLTGRIDLCAVMRGDRKPSLIDLKRVYAVSPAVGPQIAAYRFGTHYRYGIECARGFALQVKDGKVQAIEFPDYKDDLQAFWWSHSLYCWQHKKGLVTPSERK